MTTNKLVRLDDVLTTINKWVWIKSWNHTTRITWSIEDNILALTTYTEPTKWSNHAILQEYIDASSSTSSIRTLLLDIQSRLTEWMEYVVWGIYEFSDDGKEWKSANLESFETRLGFHDKIRPISPISSEELQAIELLKSLNYTVTK
jgi:hypothetical protein